MSLSQIVVGIDFGTTYVTYLIENEPLINDYLRATLIATLAYHGR